MYIITSLYIKYHNVIGVAGGQVLIFLISFHIYIEIEA